MKLNKTCALSFMATLAVSWLWVQRIYKNWYWFCMSYCRYVFALNMKQSNTPYGMWLVYRSDIKKCWTTCCWPAATLAFFFFKYMYVYSAVILRYMQLFVMFRSDRVLLTVCVLLLTSVSVVVKGYHNPFVVSMNCLMFKAVKDVYGYMYIYRCEYKCIWSKEINVKYFPVLPPITHCEYQFRFYDMYFTLSNMFQQGGFQSLLAKSLFTWTHMYHI